MPYSTFPWFKHTFSILCFVCTFCMISFWCYKFSKDEDLCLVGYANFRENDFEALPVLSMCIRNPVIDRKLREINANINASSYLNFLKGELYDKEMANIDYSNVSITLLDHHIIYEFVWKNGSETHYTPTNITGQKIDSVTYNGVWYSWFFKCFGLNLNPYNVGNINFVRAWFNQTIFPGGVRPRYKGFLIIFHHIHQVLQSARNVKHNWATRNDSKSYMMKFRLKNIEIIEQRNKPSKPCVEDSPDHDYLWLHDHVKALGCRAPYHILTNDTAPICSNREKMKSAYFSLTDDDHNRYYPPPCRTMPDIDYTYEEREADGNGFFKVVIFPTNSYKMITQSKAIDVQALLGTIGGYIGLFLGR